MAEDALVTLLYGLTAVSSGLNAAYFLRYRTSALRRRVGAAVMAVVCLASLTQSVYLGWGLAQGDGPVNPGPWPGVAVAGLACLSSLLVSALVVRHMVSGRTRR